MEEDVIDHALESVKQQDNGRCKNPLLRRVAVDLDSSTQLRGQDSESSRPSINHSD